MDDSSLANQGRSGYGGLLRDYLGNWLVDFVGSCGIISNVNVELQAILYGLQMTCDFGYRDIMCEYDS